LNVWGDLGLEIHPWTIADRSLAWRGPSGPLAWIVRPLAESPIDLAHTFQVSILLLLGFFIFYFSGFGGLKKKKLAGRFLSRHRRVDDSDYNPATDLEAQSSAGAVSLWMLKTHHTHI
jgi:hypothetical protein